VLSAAEVAKKLEEDGGTIVLDVLPPNSYVLHHLPGAINIPLEYVHSILPFLPPDRDIVVYCSHDQCPMAGMAASLLEDHGFSRVFEMPGGLREWATTGHTMYAAFPIDHLSRHRAQTASPGDPEEGAQKPARRRSGATRRTAPREG
jgi:rhodanese-related sulfurtransferase